jgi:CRP/FNR family cyclic AMP-dependent transcriptional regulator
MPSIAESLANVPIFRDLPRRAMERLERIARERSFKAGDEILKEGDEGVGFFLITAGKVAVTRGAAALATLKTGDYFGEMALLDNHRRSATVKATEPTVCLALLRSDFVAELRANADLAIEMLALMSRRVRELDQRLADYER